MTDSPFSLHAGCAVRLGRAAPQTGLPVVAAGRHRLSGSPRGDFLRWGSAGAASAAIKIETGDGIAPTALWRACVECWRHSGTPRFG